MTTIELQSTRIAPETRYGCFSLREVPMAFDKPWGEHIDGLRKLLATPLQAQTVNEETLAANLAAVFPDFHPDKEFVNPEGPYRGSRAVFSDSRTYSPDRPKQTRTLEVSYLPDGTLERLLIREVNTGCDQSTARRTFTWEAHHRWKFDPKTLSIQTLGEPEVTRTETREIIARNSFNPDNWDVVQIVFTTADTANTPRRDLITWETRMGGPEGKLLYDYISLDEIDPILSLLAERHNLKENQFTRWPVDLYGIPYALWRLRESLGMDQTFVLKPRDTGTSWNIVLG